MLIRISRVCEAIYTRQGDCRETYTLIYFILAIFNNNIWTLSKIYYVSLWLLYIRIIVFPEICFTLNMMVLSSELKWRALLFLFIPEDVASNSICFSSLICLCMYFSRVLVFCSRPSCIFLFHLINTPQGACTCSILLLSSRHYCHLNLPFCVSIHHVYNQLSCYLIWRRDLVIICRSSILSSFIFSFRSKMDDEVLDKPIVTQPYSVRLSARVHFSLGSGN